MNRARLYVVDLLPSPEVVDTVEAATLPGLLGQLAALQARVAARMAAEATKPPDRLLTKEEVAEALRTTVDWVQRTKLPFRVAVSEGNVRYSEHGMRRYIADRQEGYR